jgi:nitroimidazol reductase NimA-like FMN-containing flavoprotein (pyridoxamine 5'-phosphate oxidase superfamily)
MIYKLTEQEIEDLLKDNLWGHLGCNDGFNTYVYPINYLYDGKDIISHSQTGSKIKAMRQNARVCLQVEEVKNDKNWKSVIVIGKYQEVNDEQEWNNAMKAFEERRLYPKISDFLDSSSEQEAQTQLKDEGHIVFRIVIEEKKGRYENG